MGLPRSQELTYLKRAKWEDVFLGRFANLRCVDSETRSVSLSNFFSDDDR